MSSKTLGILKDANAGKATLAGHLLFTIALWVVDASADDQGRSSSQQLEGLLSSGKLQVEEQLIIVVNKMDLSNWADDIFASIVRSFSEVKSAQPKNLWLRDTLPSYIPDGRIYTFGYPSKFIANQSIATIPDFARALLDSLRNHREELGEIRRSTIFVCHSLGSLVCKQALVFAHMDRKRYGSVLNSTIGVVFMGTPHCGSNLADLGDIVGRVVNFLSATTTLGAVSSVIKRDLLTALAYDSRSLQELDLSVRQVLGKIMVTSFYELLPQPPFNALVAIRRMQRQAGSRRARPVSSRSSGSSSSGHSGCGRTVLCHSVASRLEEENQQVLMYFCDKKITTQQDAKAILTGLIFQLVQRNRRLIRHIRREFEICGANMIHSFSTLWSVFKNMIKDLKGNLLYVVVDALDECETSSCESLLHAIRGLINSSTPQGGSKTVKFLLTSRPMLLLSRGSDGAKEGLLESDNGERGYANDVRQFIHQRVDEIAHKHGCPEHTKRHLLDAMLTKAGNTFLWTHLVLSSLEDSLLASAADLDFLLAALPPSLESTYSSFVAKIPKGNLNSAHRLLSLILASSRSLSLEEINYAFTITNHHQTSTDLLCDIQPAIARTVQGILGPLVRLSSQKISLVHESLREFLLGSQDGAYSRQAHLEMPTITIKSAALHMANACVPYLLLEDFQMAISSSESSPIEDAFNRNSEVNDAKLSRDVGLRHPFYDYAAKNWHHHYALCEDISPTELSNSVMTLLEVDHMAGQTWRKYIRSQAHDATTEFPRESSSLVFACHLDLKEAAKDLLQHVRCSQHEIDETLFWSANCGHARIVELLLDSGVDPEYRGVDRQTSLLVAAAGGHLDCVKQLAGARGRCDPNVKSKTGRTALSLAAGNGHDGVVKYSLSNEVAAVAADDGDHSSVTPFVWASGVATWQSCQYLLKTDASMLTARTRMGGPPCLELLAMRSPISWACSQGHGDAVRVLLANKPRGLEDKDTDGWTPMAWAIQHNAPDTVEALFNAGARNLNEGLGPYCHGPWSTVILMLSGCFSTRAPIRSLQEKEFPLRSRWEESALLVNNCCVLGHNGTLDKVALEVCSYRARVDVAADLANILRVFILDVGREWLVGYLATDDKDIWDDRYRYLLFVCLGVESWHVTSASHTRVVREGELTSGIEEHAGCPPALRCERPGY
ncbi:hypothetical protein Micbo1qcDRAFT_181462 [Microdochium bolleyi]|uniref:Nephrocystin 3-like N-terminal domain-containing protein n=1 Tax=Microdochium bolleyi TaxID=196109 RepID=A0A136II63_9PEZI|nr:hypothetical protein Micbo1qcDRAFT_181462 [Microdochium bolleyi]